MSQTIYAADVDECTVINDTLNGTTNDGIRLQRGEYFVFFLSANSFKELAAGKNETLLVYIDFDDFAFYRLASVYRQILHEVQFHLGSRDKAAQAVYGCHETAFDYLVNRSLNRFAAFHNSFHFLPGNHAVSLNLGKDTAVVATQGNDVNVNLVANFYYILSGFRSRVSQLALRNSNFLLVSDINISLIAGNLDNFTGYNGALLDIRHCIFGLC